MTADHDALDALYPLPTAELSRQWLLTKQTDALPSEWRPHSLKGWHLAAHPDANVCPLIARDGKPIGWVVEPLAYLEGETGLTPQATAITLPVDSEFTPAQMERALYGRDERGSTNGDGFVGNWTAIVMNGSGDIQRLYLGPTHSVVFAPEKGIIATTHNLVPGLKRDTELSRAFDPIATGSVYSFGLTAFIGLQRLLPNHYLDLASFGEHRHWPTVALGPTIPGPQGAAAIVDHGRRVADVLANHYSRFKVPLSAGHDSRAVLACLRPIATDRRVAVNLFTSCWGAPDSIVDAQIATRLAAIAKLPHRVSKVVREAARPEDLYRAYVRIGESKYGPILAAAARETERPPADELNLPGMVGEMARAFLWKGKLPTAADIEPAALARCTWSPTTERVVAAAARWREGLPENVLQSPCDTLDVAFIEQRMGCLDSSSRYLFPGPGRANLSLMGTTLAVETMLRLPQDYRAKGLLQRDMVDYGWPELSQLPFNLPVGFLRLRRIAQNNSLPQLMRELSLRAYTKFRQRLPGYRSNTTQQ